MLTIHTHTRHLLSCPLTPAGPIPTAQDPDGVYPYESFVETAHRPILKPYLFITLENDHLRVSICPTLGGRVFSLLHKKTNREALSVPKQIHPVRILPRHDFQSGGIEVSFPISHSPVQNSPVLHRTHHTHDRIFAWCGERELRFGMQWTVEFSLGLNDHFLTQRTTFFNPTKTPHPWMSWSNAAVPAAPDTQFHFPSGPVLYHGAEMKTIDWDREGPRTQADVHRMIGFFWRKPDCNAFGAFTPSRGIGLYHVADPALTPGIKLWSDGIGMHEPWVSQYTLAHEQCLEIQAGPLIDQSVKDHLQPNQLRHHVEFWIPSDTPLDIRKIPLPTPTLPPLASVPLFDFARPHEVALWQQLLDAWQSKNPALLPAPPAFHDNHWPPTAIADLAPALEWTIAADPANASDWRFHLGSFLAGRDQIDPALHHLSLSQDDRAHALAGRLLRKNKANPQAAAESFRKIQSPELALHPQVIVERDLALAALGPSALEERRHWLDSVRASKDEWIIERRAYLLAAQGQYQAAKDLLDATSFQLVHQRYARKRLYHQLKKHLHLPAQDPPNLYAEDDLAEFGAYREYQED